MTTEVATVGGIPAGFVLVRIGMAEATDWIIDGNGHAMLAGHNRAAANYAILRLRKAEDEGKPEPQLPYHERQAAWVKENDLKVGDRVKVLREFATGEGGFGSLFNADMRKSVGETLRVVAISKDTICAEWYWPYFVLEKVAPTTRPMTREEFLAAWKGRGYCPLKDDRGVHESIRTVDRDSTIELSVSGWKGFDELNDYRFAADDSPISITE